MIELTEVFRQREAEFVGILDKIRSTTAGPKELETLNRRIRSDHGR